MEMSLARCCLVKEVPCFSWNTKAFNVESLLQVPHDMSRGNLKMGRHKLTQCEVFLGKHPMNFVSRRACCVPARMEESSFLGSENGTADEEPLSKDTTEDLLAKPLSSDELKALLADSERANLLRKLSEANQQNRFLKRQLNIKEQALSEFKSELADLELDIQALTKLAEEIANSAIPQGTRKISGKYIQSHLLSKIEAILEKLKELIKDVAVAQSKEVSLFWIGMAESVQVMGSFDGWSQGEYLSPEYDGSYTKFSTIVLLRPGRYEIKFLVDGEWHLSPEFPTIGEGLMKNNLLIVE